MLTVVEVKTKKQKREFLNFPLKLYKGNDCFVPPLYGDEKKIFRKDYFYYDTCEAVYYNAYRDGIMVGRISGILQKSSNEKRGEKRVRFTRFDCVDDQEAASALFGAVEKWALSLGMDTVCGPLGFSDLEREGLLIEGFDQLSTFEEQYNAEYYGRLVEGCGYAKEVDWVESKIYSPDVPDERLPKLTEYILKRNGLHIATGRSVTKFLKRYGDGFFDVIDKSYSDIYGTVPFTDGMKNNLMSNFKLIIDLKHLAVVVNDNDEVVCMGICFPSIARAVQKSNGHLTPFALIRLLKAIKRPKVLDLGLVGVDPEYANKGISAVICNALADMLANDGIEYAETNLNLEYNSNILNMWKRFNAVQHKRRRSYVKLLKSEDAE